MSKYCKRCLAKISEDKEYCYECTLKMNTKSISEKVVNYLGTKGKEINSKRKFCVKCGKQLGFDSIASKDENMMCSECRIIVMHDSRITEMKNAKSYIVFSRPLSTLNILQDITINIEDTYEHISFNLKIDSGNIKSIELNGQRRYIISAKLPMVAVSKELFIDISNGESVYVEVNSYGSGGLLSLIKGIKTGDFETVVCKIKKREIFEDGELKVFEL